MGAGHTVVDPNGKRHRTRLRRRSAGSPASGCPAGTRRRSRRTSPSSYLVRTDATVRDLDPHAQRRRRVHHHVRAVRRAAARPADPGTVSIGAGCSPTRSTTPPAQRRSRTAPTTPPARPGTTWSPPPRRPSCRARPARLRRRRPSDRLDLPAVRRRAVAHHAPTTPATGSTSRRRPAARPPPRSPTPRPHRGAAAVPRLPRPPRQLRRRPRTRYDAKGQLDRVTDPAGNHWTYGYDLARPSESSRTTRTRASTTIDLRQRRPGHLKYRRPQQEARVPVRPAGSQDGPPTRTRSAARSGRMDLRHPRQGAALTEHPDGRFRCVSGEGHRLHRPLPAHRERRSSSRPRRPGSTAPTTSTTPTTSTAASRPRPIPRPATCQPRRCPTTMIRSLVCRSG